jgi:predicted XRE-type DNA-binding protein
VAKILRIPQPKVSALKNYRLDGFSVEKLLEFLTGLYQDVEIMTAIPGHGVTSLFRYK